MTGRSRAAAAALLLAMTACGSSGGPSGASPSPARTTPEATPSEATVSPPSQPASGSPAPRATVSPPPNPSTPTVGTYRYSTSIDIGTKTYSGERTLAYYAPEPAGHGRAHVTVRQTTRAGTGPAKEWWFRFLWGIRGIYREKEINPSDPCTLDRPLLEIPIPLRIGEKWHSSATCKEDGNTVTVDGKVTGAESRTVGGESVAVFVLERSVMRAAPGATTQPLLETRWFSPARGIDVRMRTRAAGTPFDLIDTLGSLRPEPLPEATRPPGF